MANYTDQRQGNFAASANGFTPRAPMIGQYGATGQAHRAQTFLSAGTPMQNAGSNVAALAHSLAGMNLHPQSYGSSAKSSSQMSGSQPSNASQLSSTSSDYDGLQAFYYPGQRQVYYQPGAQAANGMPHTPAYGQMAHLMPQAAYHGYPQQMVEHSPVSNNWTPALSNGNTPTMYTPRRESFSSNDNDLPGTPFNYGGYQGPVAVYDRSPNLGFAHGGTPSPSQLGVTYAMPQVGKSPPQLSNIPMKLQLLVQQHPAIPKAIPAPSSPLKPLDSALRNSSGETNVYIRGLQPETTDEMLHSWGSRFGDIQSSKAIIDLKTNLCKGFGFIRYHNFQDAEDCIRGFHFLGYEVSFARESFYSKLKVLSDEHNTNLYVSNIPKNMNEHELALVFAPHKVCSTRVLRDPSGNGRGVGFARFESREVCEEIIKNFNNTPVNKPGCEEHLIQIRYSDTHEQKILKQHTAAARAFRANEFEWGVMQARTGSMLTADQQAALPGNEARNEFENYLQANVGSVYTPRYTMPASRPMVQTAPMIAYPTQHVFALQAPSINCPPVVKVDGEGSSAGSDTEAKATGAPTNGADMSNTSSKAASDHE
ncbi:hypothetical protein H2199_003653 [Coniosporium tulheliwenetii]|uniref:Uncharacterized protein n=1 Tax=Coniosporium tulheliwenetii TaxID=3383036 RepID=A0ACC2ZB25_9PEZI|nr:hypothetical protein H2199_003653 [Cladosporium sp. JES 115]